MTRSCPLGSHARVEAATAEAPSNFWPLAVRSAAYFARCSAQIISCSLRSSSVNSGGGSSYSTAAGVSCGNASLCCISSASSISMAKCIFNKHGYVVIRRWRTPIFIIIGTPNVLKNWRGRTRILIRRHYIAQFSVRS